MAEKGITINFDDDDEVLEVPEPEADLAGEIGFVDKIKLQIGAITAQAQMNRRRTAGIVAAGLIIVILCAWCRSYCGFSLLCEGDSPIEWVCV